MGKIPNRQLKAQEKQSNNDTRQVPTRKNKRKFRLNLGPLRVYIDDEFEELIQDELEPGLTPVRRRLLLMKAVPLGLVAWVTDIVSIFVQVSK